MKNISLSILIVCILASCSNLHKVQIIKQSKHDTLYINTLQHDSVYIDRIREVERKPDTLIIHDKEREYRYRFIHDTTRIVSVDSIPVVHEVEVVRTERHVPGIYKWALGICILVVVGGVVMIVVRIIK